MNNRFRLEDLLANVFSIALFYQPQNAYDHIKNKLKLGYEYIGEHSVKNIKDPVRVYHVLMDPADAGNE